MDQERYDKGMANLKKVMGDGAQMVTGMQDTAPDLARYVVELFGDALADPVLDLKTREIATVAALTALGYAQAELKAHIGGALNVGATRRARAHRAGDQVPGRDGAGRERPGPVAQARPARLRRQPAPPSNGLH